MARVDVVLQTYNRADLLPGAIESIIEQDFGSWELVIVDDRSTDNTPEIIAKYKEADRRVRSVVNDRYPQSCSGARKRGIDEIKSDYVAFLDSDDRWPPYHLSDLAAILDRYDDIDWVFGDLRRVDLTGRIRCESKLREEWTSRGEFSCTERDDVFVMHVDGLVENILRHDFNPGMQVSLVRQRVLQEIKSRVILEADGTDDRLLALEAAAAGFVFAYVLRNHLTYHVHDGNLSGVDSFAPYAHRLKVQREIAHLWKEIIPSVVPMTTERRAIVRRRLADHLVWSLGNAVHRAAGKRLRAAACILRGIRLRPFEWRYWKTLAGTLLGA